MRRLPLLTSEISTSSTYRELVGIYRYLQAVKIELCKREKTFVILCDNQSVIWALSGIGFRQNIAANRLVDLILTFLRDNDRRSPCGLVEILL